MFTNFTTSTLNSIINFLRAVPSMTSKFLQHKKRAWHMSLGSFYIKVSRKKVCSHGSSLSISFGPLSMSTNGGDKMNWQYFFWEADGARSPLIPFFVVHEHAGPFRNVVSDTFHDDVDDSSRGLRHNRWTSLFWLENVKSSGMMQSRMTSDPG